MSVFDIAIIVVIAAIVAFAVYRAVGTAKGTRDCCSGDAKNSGGNAGKSFAKADVEDTDPSHYPYEANFEIGGMSCEHCVANVTNALDSVDGTWAEVSLAGGHAHVRAKSPIDVDAYRKVVEEAGYRLIG